MPTEQRVQGTVVEISQKLENLGYTNLEVVDPSGVDESEEKNEDNEEDPNPVFYIFAETPRANFYIAITTGANYGKIVYPYQISNHIGEQLEDDDVDYLVSEQEYEFEDDEDRELMKKVAGEQVIEQTPIEDLWHAKFNLSAYATTALAEYEETLGENGFPIQFKCQKGILPYEDDFSLRTLDNSINAVLIAGNRGRRYIEASLYVDDEGDPDEYVIGPNF